jgi:hypothetical protein
MAYTSPESRHIGPGGGAPVPSHTQAGRCSSRRLYATATTNQRLPTCQPLRYPANEEAVR